MSRKFKKSFIILIILLVIFLQYRIFAVSASELTPNYTPHSGEFKKFGGTVLGYIRNIAAILSVILIGYFGLKIMFGSVDQKAEYKKYFLPLIVGIVVVLSATAITSAVWKL